MPVPSEISTGSLGEAHTADQYSDTGTIIIRGLEPSCSIAAPAPRLSQAPLAPHSAQNSHKQRQLQNRLASFHPSLFQRGAVPGARTSDDSEGPGRGRGGKGSSTGLHPAAGGPRTVRRWGCSCRSWRGASGRCTRQSTRCCDTPAPSA